MEIGGVGVVIAFAAGLASFVSPCVLPLVPGFLAYLAGSTVTTAGAPPPRRAVLSHTGCYVLGFSLIFITFGAGVALLGFALRDHQAVMERVAGALLMLMGLHMMQLLPIPWLYQERQLAVPGLGGLPYLRSLSMGAAFAVGWTPCVGPTLAAILGLSAASSTAWEGAILLAIYALGLAIPFLLAAVFLGSAPRVIRRLGPFLPRVSFAAGTLLIVVGVFVFTEQFLRLNNWFADFGIWGTNL